MAQLTNDCFAFGGELMRADAALAILAARVAAIVDAETVPLRAARGRILAEDVVAGRSVPPHDNAAVDGYAVRFEDLSAAGETRLAIEGRAAAGRPWSVPLRQGEAVRVFTGAPMPEGADTVLMQEDCPVEGGAVIVPPGIKRGANRRRAGEDVTAGHTILTAGRRLRPQEIGLAASVGATTLRVFRPLTVAVLSTGDELVEPGAATPPGAVYDANRHALIALLEGLGARVADLGILPDRREAIAAALETAASTADAIITSGGMSTGEEDHVRAAIEGLGGNLHFWRLAIRPGRPVGLGQVRGVPVIGLPGNPVAMMVTFLRFARAVLLRLGGAQDVAPTLYRVRAGFDYRKKPTRREWLRARVSPAADGVLVATKFPRDGAGILTSLVEADGLIELPEELTHLEAGAMVDFLPFAEVT